MKQLLFCLIILSCCKIYLSASDSGPNSGRTAKSLMRKSVSSDNVHGYNGGDAAYDSSAHSAVSVGELAHSVVYEETLGGYQYVVTNEHGDTLAYSFDPHRILERYPADSKQLKQMVCDQHLHIEHLRQMVGGLITENGQLAVVASKSRKQNSLYVAALRTAAQEVGESHGALVTKARYINHEKLMSNMRCLMGVSLAILGAWQYYQWYTTPAL